ncbi:MAG: SsrA-binding protein SmpB [bacterium]
MSNEKLISSNKHAYHEYHIYDKYQAGIVLTGTEIKAVRAGKVNLKDSFVKIESGEAWLYNAHISPYEQGNVYNQPSLRKRKLLLRKEEINKLIGKTKESGNTIVPTKLFLSNGWAKIEIAIAKGKNLHDKRETLAKKDLKREVDRALKDRY